MSEKKNMTGKENSFHMENFRRRSRYAAVFLVLILAFAAITVTFERISAPLVLRRRPPS